MADLIEDPPEKPVRWLRLRLNLLWWRLFRQHAVLLKKYRAHLFAEPIPAPRDPFTIDMFDDAA